MNEVFRGLVARCVLRQSAYGMSLDFVNVERSINLDSVVSAWRQYPRCKAHTDLKLRKPTLRSQVRIDRDCDRELTRANRGEQGYRP
jgi:hypothetical protein